MAAGPKKSSKRSKARADTRGQQITALKRQVVELKRRAMIAERMRFESLPVRKSQLSGEMLAAGIAHEFNNILGAIDGHADWALESGDKADMREALEITRLACSRSAQITRALQGLTQPREDDKDTIDMAEFCLELRRILHSLALRFEVNFESEVPPSSFVYASRGRLLEVFVNLAKNAMEALRDLPAPRELRVDAVHDQAMLRIFVHDNGPGVPATLRKLIFQPFFTTKGVLKRIHKDSSPELSLEKTTQKTGEGGSGLGLFLAHSFIEELGGQLALLDEAPELLALKIPSPSPQRPGAIFEIQLPLLNARG
jgi:signal transduction histidine kinase